MKVKVTQSCPTLWDPRDPWNSLGQNTGVGSLSLLQEIFLIQELNWGLLHCRQILYRLGHQGSTHQSEPHFTAPFGQLAPCQGLAGTRTEEQLGSLPVGTPASPPRVLDSLPLGALVFCGFFSSVSTESLMCF